MQLTPSDIAGLAVLAWSTLAAFAVFRAARADRIAAQR